MSFSNSARRARDVTLPLGVRVQSLHSCVGDFSPWGFAETRTRLRSALGVDGTGWTSEQIIEAADLLSDTRDAWFAVLAERRRGVQDAERRGRRPAEEPLEVGFDEWLSTFVQTDRGRRWSTA